MTHSLTHSFTHSPTNSLTHSLTHPPAFSVHRSSKIHFLKICTWWHLVTLAWFWPPVMSKIRFLCIGAQKYNFWKFALNYLWQDWPTPIPIVSNSLKLFLSMTDVFIHLIIPEILRYLMIFHLVLTYDYCRCSWNCTYTCALFSVTLHNVQLHNGCDV